MAEESAVSAASLARAARTQAALRAAMVAAQSYNQVRLFISPNERFPAHLRPVLFELQWSRALGACDLCTTLRTVHGLAAAQIQTNLTLN